MGLRTWEGDFEPWYKVSKIGFGILNPKSSLYRGRKALGSGFQGHTGVNLGIGGSIWGLVMD